MLSGYVGWLNGGSGLINCEKKVDMYINKKKSFSIDEYRACVYPNPPPSGTLFFWLFCPKIGGGHTYTIKRAKQRVALE